MRTGVTVFRSVQGTKMIKRKNTVLRKAVGQRRGLAEREHFLYQGTPSFSSTHPSTPQISIRARFYCDPIGFPFISSFARGEESGLVGHLDSKPPCLLDLRP